MDKEKWYETVQYFSPFLYDILWCQIVLWDKDISVKIKIEISIPMDWPDNKRNFQLKKAWKYIILRADFDNFGFKIVSEKNEVMISDY